MQRAHGADLVFSPFFGLVSAACIGAASFPAQQDANHTHSSNLVWTSVWFVRGQARKTPQRGLRSLHQISALCFMTVWDFEASVGTAMDSESVNWTLAAPQSDEWGRTTCSTWGETGSLIVWSCAGMLKPEPCWLHSGPHAIIWLGDHYLSVLELIITSQIN